jgi:hypothetical protein
VKKISGRHRKAPSLYRLAFEDAVSALIKAKQLDISENVAHKVGARPKKVKKGSRRKGYEVALELLERDATRYYRK